MPRSPKRPLSRDRAWACVTWNFSVSGLGTLRAGRIFSGVCQLGSLLAGAGFLCAWTIEEMQHIIQSGMGETAPSPAGWLWKGAVICVATSWSWMLLSCVSLMWQVKAEEDKHRRNAPPRLEDLSKKNSENQ
jgi:hypothetical protein